MESHFNCFVPLLVMLGLFTVNAERGQFPCGYKYFKEAEGWFKMSTESVSWSEARRDCELEATGLASPTTDSIKRVMLSIMYAHKPNDDNNVYQLDRSRIIHTAMSPTSTDALNEVEPQSLGLTDLGNLVKVSQNEYHPYICYKNAPETPQLNECGTIDNGYTLDNRTHHCYKFHRGRFTWHKAAAACETEGGHLAIINSEEEALVIQDIFADNPADFISGWAWKDSAFLGFSAGIDIEKREWMTVQGRPLAATGYEGWAPGEPNNARGDENCGSVGRNGKLYDDPCLRELPFICEKRPTNRCGPKKSAIVDEAVLSQQAKADVLINLIEGRATHQKQ